MDPASVGLTLACTISIAFLFVGLALVCDDYLAPSLERLVKRFHIPHNVASATFLAFGSSAPEICINCVATYRNHVTMSLGAILGSGLIAFTVIPAASVAVSKGQTLELELGPLLRDVFFYVVSVVMFIFFVEDWTMGVFECTSLVAVFCLYIAVMAIFRGGEVDENEDESAFGDLEEHHKLTGASESGSYGGVKSPLELGPGGGGSADIRDQSSGILNHLTELAARPYELIFSWTMPSVADEEASQPWWPITLVIALLYVTLLSDAVLQVTVVFAKTVGLSHNVAGLTILALGAQIPDTFASMSVARAGEGPSAVANAVGSNTGYPP